MAEFLIGPLLTLGAYLGKWAIKKYQNSQRQKEHELELLEAVQNLSLFAHEKAAALKQVIGACEFRSNSFRIHHSIFC